MAKKKSNTIGTQDEDDTFENIAEQFGAQPVPDHELPHNQEESEQPSEDNGFDPGVLQNEEQDERQGFNPGEWTERVDREVDNESSLAELKKGKSKSLFTMEECPVSRCTVTEENKELKAKIQDLRRQLHETSQENEKLKKGLNQQLSESEQEELTLKALRSPHVQSLKQQRDNYYAQLKDQMQNLNKVREQLKELQEERQQFMTSYQLDANYAKKVKRYRNLEKSINLMTNKEQELEARLNALTTKHDKLVEAYNQKMAELNTLQRKIKDMKVLVKKGIKLTPENKPSRNPLRKLLPWRQQAY